MQHARRTVAALTTLAALAAAESAAPKVTVVSPTRAVTVTPAAGADLDVVVRDGGDRVGLRDRATGRPLAADVGRFERPLGGTAAGLTIASEEYTLMRAGRPLAEVSSAARPPATVSAAAGGPGTRLSLSTPGADWEVWCGDGLGADLVTNGRVLVRDRKTGRETDLALLAEQKAGEEGAGLSVVLKRYELCRDGRPVLTVVRSDAGRSVARIEPVVVPTAPPPEGGKGTGDGVLNRVKSLRLPDLEGRAWDFHGDRTGRLVLLSFWGTWCTPCLRLVPHLKSLESAYGRHGLEVVGVACERDEQSPADRTRKVADMARSLGIRYKVVLADPPDVCQVQKQFRVREYPTLVLLNGQGDVLWTGGGSLEDRRVLEKELHRRLGAP